MKVTITADTGDQELEVSRQAPRVRSGDATADQAARIRTLDGLVEATVADARRAAGLAAEFEPGNMLVAWREIVSLTGCDDPPVESPQSVVDRVAVMAERESDWLNAQAARTVADEAVGMSPLKLRPGDQWSVRNDGADPDMIRLDVRDPHTGTIRWLSFPIGSAGAVAAALQRITP